MPITLKKRGAVYHASGTVAGRSIRRSTGCRTLRDAKAWADTFEREALAQHTQPLAERLTLAQAALDYMNQGGERRMIGPILEYFGPDYLLKDLDNTAIADAALEMFPGCAGATVNRHLITPLRAIVNLAADDGKTHYRKLRMRPEGKPRTRWLRPSEAEALLTEAGDHLRPILAVMLGTGARVQELLTAEVPNLHLATGEIWLENTKNDHPRMLRMPARARDELAGRDLPKQGAIFRKPDGAAYALTQGKRGQTPIKTAFNRARDAAGLGADVTPHVLRHTWATWYYAQTRNFGGLLDLGGWRVADMAQRYRKIAPDNLSDQLATLGWRFDLLGRDLPARKDVISFQKRAASIR